ncbi:inorganic phosphate transporter [Nonomuraea sp. NPDC049758]|uniref:inorganic phosphate transporter n=1 Tax=Nonomuraea sp. NPDC049758 TaxID=3154360 RepID=UPI00341B8209
MIIASALAVAAGTYIDGWRIIRTLGRGMTEIQPPQGFAAECSSAAVVRISSPRDSPSVVVPARAPAERSGRSVRYRPWSRHVRRWAVRRRGLA